MDKSIADDIRVELEENRQYLVRALRAVEVTTAECKEETRQVSLKAENAWSRLHLLEGAVADKDGEISRIQKAGEQSIRDLYEKLQDQENQLEDQRDQTVGFQEALEAQALTIRDLREQVYSLQLRVLKNDEEADRAGSILNRVAEDRITAVASRVAQCESFSDNLKWQVQAVREEVQAVVQQQIAEIAGAVQNQDAQLEQALHAAELKLQAQLSNAESLSGLYVEELESRTTARFNAMASEHAPMREYQSDMVAMESALMELKQNWQASVRENKSEVEAMFKGEMMLTQRINAMEGTFKSETSAQVAELEAAVAQATSSMDALSAWVRSQGASKDDLNAFADETARKDDEFRAKLELVADEIDKQSVLYNNVGMKIGEVQKRQEILEHAVEQTSRDIASNEPQLAQVLPKIEALEQLVQSVESLITNAPTPTPTPRDSPRVSALASFNNMHTQLKEQSDKIKAVENQIEAARVADKSNNISEDIASLRSTIEKLAGSVKALATKMDESSAQPRRAAQDIKDLDAKLYKDAQAAGQKHEQLAEQLKDFERKLSDVASASIAGSGADSSKTAGARGTEEMRQHMGAETTRDSTQAQMEELNTGLRELKQEHMNLYGRVVSMERANKSLEGKSASVESAGPADPWAMEGRVSRIELAMIDILEKQALLEEGAALGDDARALMGAELASSQVVEGVQKLTETMSEVLEKQRLLEEQISERGGRQMGVGLGGEGSNEGLVEEVRSLKKGQQVWQKEIERAVQLTTDAFGDQSPFVSKLMFDALRVECVQKMGDFQRDLNEKSGSTPRTLPVEESTRHSQVFDKQNKARTLALHHEASTLSPKNVPREFEITPDALHTELVDLETKLSNQLEALRVQQEHLKYHVADQNAVAQQEVASRVALVEGRVAVVEAVVLSWENEVAESPDKREALNMQTMQQYQVAMSLANERLHEHQVDILKSLFATESSL